MDVRARCYFVDVGQGTCQIIYLGQGRAIVIDTGRYCPRHEKSKSIMTILHSLKIATIEALVLSHNDNDHIGEASTILTNYCTETARNVHSVWLLQDRPVENLTLLTSLQQAEERGCQVRHLADASKPKILFEDVNANLVLKVLYPSFLQTLVAQKNKKPNTACAILQLVVGKSKLLFTGDASLDALTNVHTAFGTLSLDIMSVPHHGSCMGMSNSQLSWIYGTAFSTKFAVISTGTTNQYSHPSENVICAIRQSGAEVLCTQVTSKCSTCLTDWRKQRGTFNLDISRSQPDSSKGKPISKNSNIACCGTIAVDISDTTVEIVHLERFQAWKMQQSSRLCR